MLQAVKENEYIQRLLRSGHTRIETIRSTWDFNVNIFEL